MLFGFPSNSLSMDVLISSGPYFVRHGFGVDSSWVRQCRGNHAPLVDSADMDGLQKGHIVVTREPNEPFPIGGVGNARGGVIEVSEAFRVLSWFQGLYRAYRALINQIHLTLDLAFD
ncbi:hypothetical protein NE237_018719 [Protea cynaroides]|uniref:Uncharacterized protein n=1 Tax=Protea cynaroides TaxID=273540 RepID=A0A9Q0QP98_9MAGN|nr:hypothetical protein NE237_018719 [Protea cynaroides]